MYLQTMRLSVLYIAAVGLLWCFRQLPTGLTNEEEKNGKANVNFFGMGKGTGNKCILYLSEFVI